MQSNQLQFTVAFKTLNPRQLKEKTTLVFEFTSKTILESILIWFLQVWYNGATKPILQEGDNESNFLVVDGALANIIFSTVDSVCSVVNV